MINTYLTNILLDAVLFSESYKNRVEFGLHNPEIKMMNFSLCVSSVLHPCPPASGVTREEISGLAKGVSTSYQEDVVSLACLMHLTESAFAQFTNPGISQLLKLQNECVAAFMRDRGINAEEVCAASNALERAGRTAEYLDKLPN